MSEVTRLSRLLHACDDGLSICSITGPGGVGKTYLVEQVLSSERPRELGYIYLSADASNPQTRGDFFGLVEGQLATSSLPPPARPNRDYFPRTRTVAAAHRKLVEKAAVELDARVGAPEKVKEVAVGLLRVGQVLNKEMPKSRGRLGVTRLGLGLLLEEPNALEILDRAWDLARALNSVSGSPSLPGPIGGVLGQNFQDRVRRDLFNVTAEALLSDLASVIDAGDNRRRWGRPKKEKPDRLLVILDDYEVLAPLLGDFLVGSLIPRLASAPFPTLLVVVSRDDLEATHPGWGQHAKRWLREQIRLAPFDEETAFGLLVEAGIAEERWASIYEATRGFPFLLTLAIEEATAPDAESALFAKKFFDRTTRWMTPKEREWFAAVCYLDTITRTRFESCSPKKKFLWSRTGSSVKPRFAIPQRHRFGCVRWCARRSYDTWRRAPRRGTARCSGRSRGPTRTLLWAGLWGEL